MTQSTPEDRKHLGMLRLKPVEDILHQQDDESAVAGETGQFVKRLGLKDLIGFGVGMIIGTGIFTLTGIEAKNHAGPAVVLAFLIAGAVSGLAALCYAELAAAVPTAGSAYTYTYATIGEIFAWIIGWDLVLEFALGAAVVSRGWSGYMLHLFPWLPSSLFGEGSVINVGAIVIAIILGMVATIGVRESAWVTNLLVAVKVSICVFIIALGAFFVKAQNWQPFIPPSQPSTADAASGLKQPLSQWVFGFEPAAFGIGGVLTATAVVFFAYSGFESVANMAEESTNPAKDMPRGLIGALVLCMILYMGVSAVITGMVPYDRIDEGAPLAAAFTSVGLGWAGILISIAAICGLTSVILVDIVGMGRIGFAMGRDKLLPAWIGRLHPKYGTPSRMTLLTTAFVVLLGGFVPLAELADMVAIGTLFAFVVVSVAVPVLRRTRPDLKRPFRVPFSPVVPIISVLACLFLMTNLSLETWIRFLVWFGIGVVIYATYSYRHARVGDHNTAS
ncbi:APC family permease [Dermatophilus congolensis]|nr:amino acid permease [Dermatophilus congolensis]MBO3129175.1 amino acid permease [Dermatophilus congolensis]MBO3132192.1 amino acid permease [Dermatophilus congolensis]MBO3133652.1 amino acid permease [Dermatophilus congolensis]MBO3135885.1 amino acid permease [Dermatophilus congolensis]MBO3138125.1 amino acid permease [Dermatophilus congolensis]